MQLYTAAECGRWLSDRGFALEPGGPPARQTGQHAFTVGVPSYSRGQMELSRTLAEWLGEGAALLWVTDWPLYIQDEMDVFLTYRGAFAETRDLIEKPGHLFERLDTDARSRLTQLTY